MQPSTLLNKENQTKAKPYQTKIKTRFLSLPIDEILETEDERLTEKLNRRNLLM